jgi:hypothetical protein
MKIIPGTSHCDHGLSDATREFILAKYADRAGFFIDTLELPPELGTVPCSLHGPATGEAPVTDDEAYSLVRGTRPNPSRMCQRPTAATTKVTVIAGPADGYEDIILYTAFGGPLAPKEPDDPTLNDAQRAESEAFWAVHALSA